MKAFLAGIVVLILLAAGGFFAYKYFGSRASSTQTTTQVERTLTGILQKIQSTGEYSHVINVGGKLTGVTSSTVDLTPYEGKNVRVTGQYSGTTMYADKVEALQ